VRYWALITYLAVAVMAAVVVFLVDDGRV